MSLGSVEYDTSMQEISIPYIVKVDVESGYVERTAMRTDMKTWPNQNANIKDFTMWVNLDEELIEARTVSICCDCNEL